LDGDNAPYGRIGPQPAGVGARQELDVVALQDRPHGADVGVALGEHPAREAVAGLAADAAPAGPYIDTHRQLERVQPLLAQPPGQLGDAGLVRSRRARERPRAPAVEDLLATPVLRLLGQEIAALEQQQARAAVAQGVGERPTAHAGPDDDDIVRASHPATPLSRALRAVCLTPRRRNTPPT